MRRLLIGTMFLVVPSFVLLYGWGTLSTADYQREISYGEVEVNVDGVSRSHLIETGMVEAETEALQQRLLFRAFQLQGGMQGLDFDLLRRAARTLISDEYKMHQVARGLALRAEAEGKGVGVTTAMAIDSLRSMASGMTERELRENLRRQMGISLEDYLVRLEGQLLETRGAQLMAAQVHTSLYELWQEYQVQNEELTIDYVAFRINEHLASIEPTEEELEEYFQEHRDEFRIPDRIQVAFVARSTNDLTAELRDGYTAEEVAARYEQDKETAYRRPKSLKVRQMAFKIDENRTEDDAMAIAAGVQVRLGMGEDFDAIAAEQSDWNASSETIADEGDDLAALGVGADFTVPQLISERSRSMGPLYLEAVLPLEQGDLSEPFIAEWGFGANRFRGVFLVEVLEVTEESFQPLEEVESIIRNRMASQAASEAINDLQADWESVVYDYTTLDGFAEWAGLEPAEPQWIDFEDNRVGRLTGVAGDFSRSYPLLDTLRFEGGLGVIRIGGSLIAVEVLDTANAYVPKSMTDDEGTSIALVRSTRNKLASLLAEEQAEEFAAAVADNPTSFTEIAEEQGRVPVTVGPAMRSAIQDRNLMSLDGFEEKTLEMGVGDTRTDGLYVMANGHATSYLVWRLSAKTDPDMSEFREQVPQLELNYLSRKQQGILEEHYADLLREGGVVVKPNESLLRSREGGDF